MFLFILRGFFLERISTAGQCQFIAVEIKMAICIFLHSALIDVKKYLSIALDLE